MYVTYHHAICNVYMYRHRDSSILERYRTVEIVINFFFHQCVFLTLTSEIASTRIVTFTLIVLVCFTLNFDLIHCSVSFHNWVTLECVEDPVFDLFIKEIKTAKSFGTVPQGLLSFEVSFFEFWKSQHRTHLFTWPFFRKEKPSAQKIQSWKMQCGQYVDESTSEAHLLCSGVYGLLRWSTPHRCVSITKTQPLLPTLPHHSQTTPPPNHKPTKLHTPQTKHSWTIPHLSNLPPPPPPKPHTPETHPLNNTLKTIHYPWHDIT